MSQAVACPNCNSPVTRVLESRSTAVFGPTTIRRRRECMACRRRFTTFEIPIVRLAVVGEIWRTRADHERMR